VCKNCIKHINSKVLKGGKFSNGYRFVCLRKNGINKNVLVHRLVAKSFVPNYEELKCVNHLDGDKLNNSIENLEWCTFSQNRKHAYATGLAIQRGHPIKMIATKNNESIIFDSIKDCCAFFGYGPNWIYSQRRKYNTTTFVYNGYLIEAYEENIL
jgi:hypothetical protein